MKIYVVLHDHSWDYQIITATTDRDMAVAIKDKFDKHHGKVNIEVFDSPENMLKNCWHATFNKDGSLDNLYNRSTDASEYGKANIVKTGTDGSVYMNVLSDDPAEAIKIATKKYNDYMRSMEQVGEVVE